MFDQARIWAKTIKRNVIALWLAARDPRTPWLARLVAAGVAAYALSPIDLIPDFVPVLGYLDDIIIVPLGILLAVKLIPTALMSELLEKAQSIANRPRSLAGAVFVALVWIALAGLACWWLRPWFSSHPT